MKHCAFKFPTNFRRALTDFSIQFSLTLKVRKNRDFIIKPLLRLAVSLNNHAMSQLYFSIFGVTIVYQCKPRKIISAFRLTNCYTGGKNVNRSINQSIKFLFVFFLSQTKKKYREKQKTNIGYVSKNYTVNGRS